MNMGPVSIGCVVTKIEEAFDNAEERESTNSTVPPVPKRPMIPSFCTAPDTIMYIFGSCTIQNSRVYVGKTYARDLDQNEKKKMSEFQHKMAERQKVSEG
ncbi:hypothetical protein WR25_10885 [Diploscapter pachys]|uniref:Pepsin inhibitor-3-like repeated domain-containing protein n=1 Tax=Diploscapter pachys TaxID=2018661 RepID=A0A2A2LZ98_9BILA|nr:hypothetical protein WR25_10885 [Diploscapter pachys]